MRRLIAALSLGCALAAPAVAVGWHDDIDEFADGWTTEGPQSEWSMAERPLDGRLAVPPADRAGDGWMLLDGWMRGDPLLRHWVLHRFDLDGDAWLTASEAEAAQRTFYQIADANGSGRITSEEFVDGWAQVRQELRGFYALDVG